MRNLASIQEIKDVVPIEGADSIELVKILGWQCVTKKGEFKQGDLCIYFEVDTYLPVDDKRYEFLHKTCYRNNDFMGEGLRVKTIQLRGQISQGLALPIKLFPEVLENVTPVTEIGTDVSNLLRVRKWDMPEIAGTSGVEIGDKPYSIPTTDETRIQSMPEIIKIFQGNPYYITTKLDGTSCTVYCKDGVVGVCGRNKEYKEETEKSKMWKFVIESGFKQRLIDYCIKHNLNLVFQGEFCGEGIQKNPLKLRKPNLFIFDVMNLDTMEKFGFKELLEICDELDIDTVPIEKFGSNFNYTLEELLELARGQYESGVVKEGIVVRTQKYGRGNYGKHLNHKNSFKVINNDFLKKEKG